MENPTGIEFTFDKNGLVSDKSKISIEHAKEIDHYLKASSVSKDGGAGAAIAFLPAGIPIPCLSPLLQIMAIPTHLISHKTAYGLDTNLSMATLTDFSTK